MLTRFLVRRLLLAIPTLVGVATVIFFLVRLIPGDPAEVMAGATATPAQVERLRTNFGLNESVPVQFLDFFKQLLQGNFGVSTETHDAVTRDIWLRYPNTLELAACATVLGVVVGVTLGIIAALSRGRPLDAIVSLLAVAGMSIPTYWLGLNLVRLFAIQLRWLPASGNDSASSLILPALTLGALSMAFIGRMTRSAMLEVLGQDYIRSARARGLSNSRIVFRHALPNAVPPILTIIGLQFGLMLGGAVLTESVFAWPGMGSLLIQSISARDYPVIQGCILTFALSFVVVNVIVDVLYAVIDPRVALS